MVGWQALGLVVPRLFRISLFFFFLFYFILKKVLGPFPLTTNCSTFLNKGKGRKNRKTMAQKRRNLSNPPIASSLLLLGNPMDKGLENSLSLLPLPFLIDTSAHPLPESFTHFELLLALSSVERGLGRHEHRRQVKDEPGAITQYPSKPTTTKQHSPSQESEDTTKEMFQPINGTRGKGQPSPSPPFKDCIRNHVGVDRLAEQPSRVVVTKHHTPPCSPPMVPNLEGSTCIPL
ncbi:hypothetical protein IE53DRAFT_240139 [Violaceomyces palustris]|uniref:Uncharacterized protein n=1 Tax=Violaceomyces palustris TaxID=1673888 RepID=A0ACD0P4E4_9BASI|nr:hypothetical protein IE53DRAFT_240139 [Violaceomyces palustris]